MSQTAGQSVAFTWHADAEGDRVWNVKGRRPRFQGAKMIELLSVAQRWATGELIDENAAIVGDAVEIRKDRWVVHGVLPYGGEVPVAVFDSYEEAKRALDEILAGADQAQSKKPEET